MDGSALAKVFLLAKTPVQLCSICNFHYTILRLISTYDLRPMKLKKMFFLSRYMIFELELFESGTLNPPGPFFLLRSASLPLNLSQTSRHFSIIKTTNTCSRTHLRHITPRRVVLSSKVLQRCQIRQMIQFGHVFAAVYFVPIETFQFSFAVIFFKIGRF